MTRPPVLRRPGLVPGRRLAALAPIAAAVALVASPAPALADQTVVQATVFSGGSGPVTQRPVSLWTLEGCGAYGGPTSLGLYPGAQSYTLASGSTWTLSTVLGCGLQIPAADVTDVQVQRASGYEHALSGAELTDPSRYQDPTAPGALPVVSNDGGAVQNTYTRPWRGGADANGGDQVTENGPIQIVVYENGSPLIVHVAQRTVSRAAASETVALSARVQQADLTPVAPGGLTWSWSLPDGTTTPTAAPTHTFSAGVSVVTLQVSDPATGTGGTATFTVSYKPATKPGATKHPGGGTATHGGSTGPRTTSTSATTPATDTSSTTSTTTPATHTTTTTTPATNTTPTTSTGTTTPTTPTTTTTSTHATTTATTPPSATPTTPTPTPTTTTTSSTRTSTPRRPPHRPRRAAHRRAPATAPGTRLVTGRLVGSVTPLSAAASPLTHAPTPAAAGAAAAAARPATTGSPGLGGLLAGVVALGLLGLGVARELVARRTGRAHSLHR